MAFTIEDLKKLPGAQRVAGNLVVGVLEDRIVVASTVDGVFGLTDAGRKYLDELNGVTEEDSSEVVTAPKRAGRPKKQTQVLDETPEIVVQDTTSAE
jgi:hypothetical protein